VTLAVVLGLLALVGIVVVRPHGGGPAVALVLIGGAADPADLGHALAAQWRAYVTLGSVMLMTSAAEHLGLLERLAARIEPRTRGPVRHAFAVTYVLAAAAATTLSNDAAILLLTPAVLALLRAVYPKRHPKFEVPFAFAVFAAAGVAPLVISNPMNLVFADQVGLGFNRYAAVMIPVALAGWAATYVVLVRCFRDALADEAPALGGWEGPRGPLGRGGRIVLGALLASLGAYPIASFLELPLWPIAAAGGAACVAARLAAGHAPRAIADGVAWSLFPFLAGVFVLALGLERVGVVDRLAALYAASPAPIATVGGISAIGSALLNNHPMSVLNGLTLLRLDAGEGLAFAALVGGDLGPRLLPVGSLAALLWFDILRRHRVVVPIGTFVRVGAAVTIPSLAASLVVLWLLAG
jgi:arsenical pump membrane protein